MRLKNIFNATLTSMALLINGSSFAYGSDNDIKSEKIYHGITAKFLADEIKNNFEGMEINKDKEGHYPEELESTAGFLNAIGANPNVIPDFIKRTKFSLIEFDPILYTLAADNNEDADVQKDICIFIKGAVYKLYSECPEYLGVHKTEYDNIKYDTTVEEDFSLQYLEGVRPYYEINLPSIDI